MALASPKDSPSLLIVLKQLAREWRVRAHDKTPATRHTLRSYLALPLFNLLRLISEHTQQAFPPAWLQHFAWYSDKPVELMPPLPSRLFTPPDQELDDLGLPSDHATGSDLETLRMIRDELLMCDRDGRTAAILGQLPVTSTATKSASPSPSRQTRKGRKSAEAKPAKLRRPRKKRNPRKQFKGPRVVLGSPAAGPKVMGQQKGPLTRAQYDVVKALLDAGESGLSKDNLDRMSGHGDARKVLKRLAEKDPDWREAIQFPGTTGRRYRIS
ncbi:MAG TPA: hypothetical protein VFE62_08080 [Gemmataceae bacterium]|nr:hypothetical protein [Gemmataceae bacterium]